MLRQGAVREILAYSGAILLGLVLGLVLYTMTLPGDLSTGDRLASLLHCPGPARAFTLESGRGPQRVQVECAWGDTYMVPAAP